MSRNFVGVKVSAGNLSFLSLYVGLKCSESSFGDDQIEGGSTEDAQVHLVFSGSRIY